MPKEQNYLDPFGGTPLLPDPTDPLGVGKAFGQGAKAAGQFLTPNLYDYLTGVKPPDYQVPPGASSEMKIPSAEPPLIDPQLAVGINELLQLAIPVPMGVGVKAGLTMGKVAPKFYGVSAFKNTPVEEFAQLVRQKVGDDPAKLQQWLTNWEASGVPEGQQIIQALEPLLLKPQKTAGAAATPAAPASSTWADILPHDPIAKSPWGPLTPQDLIEVTKTLDKDFIQDIYGSAVANVVKGLEKPTKAPLQLEAKKVTKPSAAGSEPSSIWEVLHPLQAEKARREEAASKGSAEELYATPPGGLQWTQVGPQLGTNPGGVYKDPSGIEHYVKIPKSSEHYKNELLGNKLYKLAGVEVPEVSETMLSGQPALASKIIEGPQLGKMGYGKNLTNKIREDFIIDAWLGNWDVLGTWKDNIIVSNSVPYRIDTGGVMRFRAQGEPKEFGPSVIEFETIPQHQPDIFGNFTAKELQVGKNKLTKMSDADIGKTVFDNMPGQAEKANDLADTLIARKYDLINRINQAGLKEEAAAKTAKPEGIDIIPKNQLTGKGIEWVESADPNDFFVYFHGKEQGQVTRLGHRRYVYDSDLTGQTYEFSSLDEINKFVGQGHSGEFIEKPPTRFGKEKTEKETLPKSSATTKTMGELFPGHGWLKTEGLGGGYGNMTPQQVAEYVQLQGVEGNWKKYQPDLYKAIEPYFKPKVSPKVSPDLGLTDEAITKALEKNPAASIGEVLGVKEVVKKKPKSTAKHKYPGDMSDVEAHLQPLDWVNYMPTSGSFEKLASKITETELYQHILKYPGKTKQLKEMGFNLHFPLFKGGEKFKNPDVIPDPAVKKQSERGWFFSDVKQIAKSYGEYVGEYVFRAENPLYIDWKKYTGYSSYSSDYMHKVIEAARKKNADLLVIDNMIDVGGENKKQTQYVLLNPSIARDPKAKFDPKHLKKAATYGGLGGVAFLGLDGELYQLPRADDNNNDNAVPRRASSTYDYLKRNK